MSRGWKAYDEDKMCLRTRSSSSVRMVTQHHSSCTARERDKKRREEKETKKLEVETGDNEALRAEV